jgi:hypothetical protein
VLLAVVFLSSCVIPGSGLEGTNDKDLLPVPRRVNYNVVGDPFIPRTDILVYKCKKDGTMVLVPIGELDKVGIITKPSDDPDEADDVSEWLDPIKGSYLFSDVGRHDVVVSYSGGTMTARYSVWAQDPLGGGLLPGGGDGVGDGGGIGLIWASRR